jgi:hypothetical protein
MDGGRAMARRKQPLVEWVNPAAHGGPDSKATVTKEGIRIAAKMTRAGHPQHGVAACMGLGREGFRKAIERQPELRQALDVSLGELEQELVHVMVAAARAGAWQPACALLKGRFGYREHGPVETPASSTQINIVIPPRLTDKEYDKIIKDITPLPDTEVVEGVVVQKRITR